MNFLHPLSRSARRPLLTLLSFVAAIAAQAQTVRKAEPVPDSELFPGDTAAGRQRNAAALTAAESGLRKDPHDPGAIAAKAAALCQAGQARAAVDWLMDLKAEYAGFFPHQLALANAFAAARMFQDAAVAYAVVANDKRYGAEQQKAARERSQTMGRDRQLIAGEHAVRTNDAASARKVLANLKTDASHPDVLALKAAILTKEGHYDEARALLNKVAATGWNSRTMAEARMALAEKESHTGAWGPAGADYRAVEKDANLTKREQLQSARMSREMLARVRPGITQSVSGSHQHEGELWTTGIELSSGAFGDGRNILFLRGIWDEIGLGHQKLITQDDADRYQAEVAWRRLTRRGFYGEVTAGGGDQGAMFGAAVGRYELPGPGWELRFRANERATDSLLLLALGGTQDAITFNIHRRLAERWYVDATLGWRRVEIDGADLGEGIDLDFRLAYTLLEENGFRPALTIGYFAEIQHFNRHHLADSLLQKMLRYARREDDPADMLIDERINRHGLVLTASKQFGARWSGFVYGGVAYEFEAERTEGIAGAGISAYLNKNTSLILGVDYSSSGNTSNKGDDTVIGSLKVRVSF